MRTYHLKQNGYAIGEARGKNKAIESMARIFVTNNISNAEWGKFLAGDLKVKAGGQEWSIEEVK